MKQVIANWKSNLDSKKIENWFKVLSDKYQCYHSNKLEKLVIVVCPPFVYIPLVKKLINENKLPFKLGAQNLSPYNDGAYTGEVSAKMLTEFVEYVIIGHSERRMKFHEDEEMLKEKASRAIESDIKIIYCISDEENLIPDFVKIVAYEPIWAIGTGQSDNPDHAAKIGDALKARIRGCKFIYGGSVQSENVISFLEKPSIDGILLGKASLDPVIFWEIIAHASKTV